MCWQCDHPEASLADYLDVLYDKVVEHGWAVQFVESDRNPFSYNVALHECGFPELLVTGVDPPRALQVLNAVADYCVCEEPPAPGDEIELPDGVLLEVVRGGPTGRPPRHGGRHLRPRRPGPAAGVVGRRRTPAGCPPIAQRISSSGAAQWAERSADYMSMDVVAAAVAPSPTATR